MDKTSVSEVPSTRGIEMMDEIRLLTLPKAARTLGLSNHAVREAVRRGELAAVRPNPNGRPLVEPEELARWARCIGLQTHDSQTNMNQTEWLVEHDAEVAEASASGREELARDLIRVLERGIDRVEPRVARQMREVLERLLS